MWKRILEPLRKKLKGENGVRLVMLLGIAGLALILLSGFLPDKAEKQTDAASVQSAETASQEQAEQYCRRMEQQLVDVLEQVEGVGSCRVMLTATGSPETIYAQDAEQEQGENRTRIQRKCVIVSDSGTGAADRCAGDQRCDRGVQRRIQRCGAGTCYKGSAGSAASCRRQNLRRSGGVNQKGIRA